MRQYITVKQLLELTPEQQERLREWWRPAGSDAIYVTGDSVNVSARLTRAGFIEEKPDDKTVIYLSCGGWCYKKECLIVPNIGQCIEFLSERDEGSIVGKDWVNTGWYRGELIDTLWEAVKGIL